ncbi:Uncharacterised protein [Bacteroides pyogenes]|nr:Uncharacterised protein [Bacteroides pyogenes]
MKNTGLYWYVMTGAWCVHNLEEALTMPAWMREHYDIFFACLPVSEKMLIGGFPYAIVIVTALLMIFAYMVAGREWDNRILAVALGAFALNSIQHVAVSVIVRGYSPGVVTALFVNLPLSFYILKRLFRHKLLKNFTWLGVFLYGALALLAALSVVWLLALGLYALFRPQ